MRSNYDFTVGSDSDSTTRILIGFRRMVGSGRIQPDSIGPGIGFIDLGNDQNIALVMVYQDCTSKFLTYLKTNTNWPAECCTVIVTTITLVKK